MSSKIERINEILNRSAWHREQLDALADELVMLHGYGQERSRATDELDDVVWLGVPYQEAMSRIMESRKRRA